MLNLLLATHPYAVLIFDTSGLILRTNQAACDLFGYSMSELLGSPLSLLLRAEDVEKHAELFAEYVQRKVELHHTGCFRSAQPRHKEGNSFPIDASISREAMDNETVLTAIVRHSSSEKQAEELLRSIALFPQENPSPVFRITAKGKILFTNSSGERMLKTVSLSPNNLAPQEWIEAARCALRDQEQQNRIFIYADRHYSFSFTPIQMMGYVNIYCQDITERELEKSRLALSDEILGSIGNLVLVANSKAEIVYISPSVKQIIGYEVDEIIGNGWWEMERISGGDVETEKDYIRWAASGLSVVDNKPYEHRVRHKDGSWRWLMLADTKGP